MNEFVLSQRVLSLTFFETGDTPEARRIHDQLHPLHEKLGYSYSEFRIYERENGCVDVTIRLKP